MERTDQNNKGKNESHIEIPGHRVKLLVRQSGGIFMKSFKNILSLMVAIIIITVGKVQAGGTGTSGGLTLLEPSGARPAALGEAFTAATNDIAGFDYNPASLKSLESGQASFM